MRTYTRLVNPEAKGENTYKLPPVICHMLPSHGTSLLMTIITGNRDDKTHGDTIRD
jgi:hypothetical protein